MSNFVSLFASMGSSAPPEAPKFSGAAPRANQAQAFSTALDRAVHSPRREVAFDKPSRSRANPNDPAREAEVRSDRREPTRGKNKNNLRDDEQSLAGASAVNGQAARLEAPGQSTAEGKGPGAEETIVGGGEFAGDETPAAIVAESAAMTSATEEVPVVVQPGTEASEVSATAELGDAFAANPETAGDLSEPTTAKVTSASAAGLGTDGQDELTSAANATTTVETLTAKEIVLTSEEVRGSVRAARRTLAAAVEKARGIGAAKLSETMKTALKKEEVAGLGQQLLPGSAAMPLAATILNPAGDGRVGASVEALNAAAKISPAPTRADVSGSGDLVELRPTSPLVRVSELISREVRMFKRGGDDLVEVVLTPDAKTQISLRLHWREGQVEVQARCDLGDHQSLNQQWPQLQAAMAQHGVRLSHLNERIPTGLTEFFSNPGFSQQQGGERRATGNSTDAESVATVPAGKSAAGQAVVRSNRLLESWA